MKSKNQLFIELKSEFKSNYKVRKVFSYCETLRDVKQTICWELNFATSIEEQIANNKHTQWYNGEIHFKTKYDVKELKESCYFVAKKLGYEIEHNNNGFHYIGKISG